ncbi:MAG: putative membrane protein YkvI [Halieaceae bacterium]|jgi:uncharacterized membrane protein YkvI
MSESEAFELVLLMASELSQLMFGYFSIVSAFLIVSYLAADRLSRLQSAIILILYTICAMYVVLNLYALNTDLDNLYAEMLTKKESGVYELAWFGTNPIWIPKSLTIIQVAIGVGGYVGSVIFFFSKSKPKLNDLFGRAT